MSRAPVLRTLLGRRRRVGAALWTVSAVLAALVAWDLGLDVGHAVLLGALVAGAGTLQLTMPELETPELPEPAGYARDGVRQEVASLTYAMRGEKGAVRESVVLRIRDLAARRLARHGLELDRQDDTERIEALLGPAAGVLVRGQTRPSASAIAACLDALDALDALHAHEGPTAPIKEKSTR